MDVPAPIACRATGGELESRLDEAAASLAKACDARSSCQTTAASAASRGA